MYNSSTSVSRPALNSQINNLVAFNAKTTQMLKFKVKVWEQQKIEMGYLYNKGIDNLTVSILTCTFSLVHTTTFN